MLFSEMIVKAGNKISPIKVKLDFDVNKLTYNSKVVSDNDVFFAIKGQQMDGNQFINEALEKGGKAVFTDSEAEAAPLIYNVDDCRKTMAVLSNVFYDFPSSKMNMIGVTGTNGKTTVANIINHVLTMAGKRTGLIGTNSYLINKKQIESTHTTPESIDLNALLYNMGLENVEFVSMEVSSHSLAMKRVYGIDFDTIVFTNLTPEHLDFHKNMDEYFLAKKLLFDSMKKINDKNHETSAIYNADDEFGKKIVSGTKSKKISFGFGDADYKAVNISMSFEKMNFDIRTPDETLNVATKLTGRFNVYNILASVGALRTFGIPVDGILTGIESFRPVEGRFNLIKLNNGALAIIDYAHTPDSLFNALKAIKEILKQNGRIITVFGCGGNRDKSKRPVMGKIASENSDYVIITSDNPRFEEPSSIIEDILPGIINKNYSVEEGRRIAIESAVQMSTSGDVILIAGKGHETYQEVKGVKIRLSDREIVEKFA